MNEIIINVKGMVCSGCENRVKNALMNINGVKSVLADYSTGKVIISASDEVTKEVLAKKIEDIGFEVL